MMQRGVIAGGAEHEIVDSVVSLDSVQMMNVFSCAESSPNVQFHDEAMFGFILEIAVSFFWRLQYLDIAL